MTDRDPDMDALREALERAAPADADDGAERTPAAGETETEGTFLVTHADEDSAVLRDVDSGRVHTLSSNPGLEAGEALEGRIAPDPPMNVTWQVVEVDARRTLPVEESAEPPTRRSLETAADQAEGELTRRERAGEGELHVITVPEDLTDDAVADLLGDPETLRGRAARLGVNRVEIRSAPGVVVVRYLP